MSYHPSSNGMVERRNREIKRHLRILCAKFNLFDQWSYGPLPYVQYLLNTTTHSVTGFTPAELLYGAHVRQRRFTFEREEELPEALEPIRSTKEYVEALTKHLEQLTTRVNKAQDEAQKDRGVVQPPLEPGDFVLCENRDQTKLQGHLGPYKVIEVHENYAITIAPLNGSENKTVHADKLIKLEPDMDEHEMQRIQEQDSEEFYVERVVRALPNRMLRIKWLSYRETSDEPLANVEHTPAVQAFLQSEEGKMWRSQQDLYLTLPYLTALTAVVRWREFRSCLCRVLRHVVHDSTQRWTSSCIPDHLPISWALRHVSFLPK